MHFVELGVIIGYFVLLAVVGKIMKKFVSDSSADFLIAGRNMGVVLVTVAVVGEWLGGMSTIGTSEKAFSSGFFPLWYNVSTAVGMFLFGLTIAKIYRENNVHTVGEMLEKMYNKKVRVVASLAFVVAFIILSYLQLQAIGSLVSQLFGGILRDFSAGLASFFHFNSILFSPYSIAIIISGIFVIFYVYEGGMKSIAFTNLMHIILLFSTLIVVFILVLKHVGGYSGLFETLQNQFVSEGQTAQKANAMVSSFKNPFSEGIGKMIAWLFGGILAGFASQASIQPIFAAKNINTAKKGAMFSAILIAPLGILVSTIGMAVRSGAIANLDKLSSPKEAFPFLLMNADFLPPWLAGLAAAGILAAILSTVAPVMFAVSTILVKDFYHLIINQDATDKQLLKMSKAMTIVVGIVSIPMAIFIRGAILEAAYITYGIRGAAAIVVILGLLLGYQKIKETWVTPKAAITAIVASTVGILIFVLNKEAITNFIGFEVDKVYVALVFSLLSIFLVTPFTKKKKKKEA
ncbi:MAG: sodium:solute symporter family protein [Candidatus Mcinerneyibacterium aminivorans]|uniref:Sodium:solute symporter family protein n=1 Tax=Candidatus Mcinerneyibacterium aminivorans TaxID=2703815 RepID=A0A5D0MHL0_9BACT|nr:MAG: sodium:solute symporter family protein [Candidatus Mcinerneyibacterium aminivorans]